MKLTAKYRAKMAYYTNIVNIVLLFALMALLYVTSAKLCIMHNNRVLNSYIAQPKNITNR